MENQEDQKPLEILELPAAEKQFNSDEIVETKR